MDSFHNDLFKIEIDPINILNEPFLTSSEEEKILAQYDKEIESFNRQGLYGSEILSLANLVEDYNKRQSDLKGYKPITLKVSQKTIPIIPINAGIAVYFPVSILSNC